MSSSSLYNEEDSEKLVTPRKVYVEGMKVRKKAKVKVPTDLDRIFHKVHLKNEPNYFTRAKSVVLESQAPILAVEGEPFTLPQSLNQLSYKVVQKSWKDLLLETEQNKKYCCKTNVRSRNAQDLLKRIYVDDPDNIEGMKTVMNIDPEFFTIVEGRPVGKIFRMSRYMEEIRSVLRLRLMNGFRNDEILLFDEKLKREKGSIEKIKKNYNLYLHSFESFLSDDYNESMHLLREAERAGNLTMEKSEKIRNLYITNAALEFNVHKLEERWRDLKMYQKFLYFISPISWRAKYDYIHKMDMDMEMDTSEIFKKYVLGSQGQFPSLTSLVAEYLECTKQEEEPVLYFTNTEQLVKVFRFIEIQNLNCLLHTEEIQVPMENMRLSMEEARKNFEKEAKVIQDSIDLLSGGIEWEENCANELKSMAMKHIDGIFRHLVSDDDVLKLHVFVEDVYEASIGKNDSELTIYDMMIAIEQAYSKLVLSLDGLPQHIVKKAEKFRFTEQARLAKLCEETTQKIALVDSITWRLKKSLEPPYVKKRDLKWRSAPPEKEEKPPAPPRDLTIKEKEFLTFFTVYCPHTDKVEDYGINLNVPETDLKKFSVLFLEEKEVRPLI